MGEQLSHVDPTTQPVPENDGTEGQGGGGEGESVFARYEQNERALGPHRPLTKGDDPSNAVADPISGELLISVKGGERS